MSRRMQAGRGGRAQPASGRWLLPTLILFVVAPVAAAIWFAVGGGDSESDVDELRRDRTGSVSLGREAVPLLPERIPVTYSIVYRIVETATDKPDFVNEELQVRRPFDARLVTRGGEDPGEGAVRSLRVSNLTKLATRDSRGAWTRFDIPPALATADVRFGAALDQALADGDIEARERRRVVKRECQVFRAGDSIQAGTLVPYEPGASTFADFCVDRDGLVLEEVWTLNGKRVQRRVAVEVQTDVDLRDDRFTIPDDARTISVAQGGGSARPIDPTTRPPGAFWELPESALPDGFAFAGRWAVIAPRVDIMRDPTQAGQPSSTTSVVDVYVRDAEVLVLDRGSTTGSGSLPQPQNPRPVDLGPLGIGIGITDFRMNEVRVQNDRDFVRIYGTVPIGILVESARSLTSVPGGELRYLDE